MRQDRVPSTHFIFLILLLAVSWFFWNLSVLLPLHILSDLLYETGKALAVLITGGKIQSVSADIQNGFYIDVSGGFAGTRVAAGYLGAMVLGGVLFLLANAFRFDKLLVMLLGAGLVVLSLVFAGGGSSMVYAVVFGVVLFLAGFLLPRFLNDLILKYIGLLGVFYVFFDIRGDLVFPANHVSEISRMASVWPGTPLLWAVIWGAAAVIEFVLILYFSRGASRRRY